MVKKLSDFERNVLDQKGTEAPYTGLYVNHQIEGVYCCKKCEHTLYQSEHKFHSDCGWPAFDDEIEGAVRRVPDVDGYRTEIVCAHCGGHLGHVFEGEGFTEKNIRHCVNSVSLLFQARERINYKKAVFASGCFWGLQYYFARAPGVVHTQVGYCGGFLEKPTYEQVCRGDTGHVEAVHVVYDPLQISYNALGRLFFETHDYTQIDGQGPDLGSQYLSVVFCSNEQERTEIESLIKILQNRGDRVATQLRPATKFWPAEGYHQHYYEREGKQPYCHRYCEIFPKFEE